MPSGEPILGSLYVYAPNKVAPVIFAVAYGISAGFHIWQCIRYKSLRLFGLYPLCGVMFTAGYALREYGAFNYLYNVTTLIVFILSQVFIYVCPPLLELANYHLLGRLFYYVPYNAPLAPGRVLSIFGGLMALVEVLNALGVSLAANVTSSNAQQLIGGYLTLAAISIQLAVIITFVILATVFHRRCIKANIHTPTVSTPLIILYISMALIFVRCVYRLVEHTGQTRKDLDDLETLRALSPILRYEWFFLIFESTLMLANSVIWNFWHPGRYLPRFYHVHLARDGTTEIEGESSSDDRPLLAKAGSVLTFGILFRRKTENRTFRELDDLTDQDQGA